MPLAPHRHVLPNGLTLVIQENHVTPAVSAVSAVAAGALMAAALGWLLVRMGPILALFAVGFVVAYLFDPVLDHLERRGWPRARAVGLVGLVMVVALVLLGIWIVPVVGAEVQQLAADWPQHSEAIYGAVENAERWFEARVAERFPGVDGAVYLQGTADRIQVVEALGDVGMLRPEDALAQGEGLLVERHRLEIAAPGVQHPAEIADAGGPARIAGGEAQGELARLAKALLRLVEPPLLGGAQAGLAHPRPRFAVLVLCPGRQRGEEQRQDEGERAKGRERPRRCGRNAGDPGGCGHRCFPSVLSSYLVSPARARLPSPEDARAARS